MTRDPDKKVAGAWMVRGPLQIERIREELGQGNNLDERLRELQRLRENVDAVIYALSNQELAQDRREHLVRLLVKQREALDEGLAELGLPGLLTDQPPLWYFNQLEPIMRRHLASILGVPEEPPFYQVLDIKAAEYLAQHSAFEFLADQLDFEVVDRLGRMSPYAALVLSLSGSLIQLSETMSRAGSRRYLYQNIYGNTHPPEGVLVLDKDIRSGHRMRSVELTTSPVRLIRVLRQEVPWKTQAEGFRRVARTLTSLASRSASQMVESGWVSSQTGVQRQINVDAAERVFREDNATHLDRFEQLRQAFKRRELEGDEGSKAEAELLTLCHLLQLTAREFGFKSRSLAKIQEFTTEEDRVYRRDPEQPGALVLAGRGQGPEVVFSGVSLGRQVITRFAPVALVGADGGLVEVTPLVISLKSL